MVFQDNFNAKGNGLARIKVRAAHRGWIVGKMELPNQEKEDLPSSVSHKVYYAFCQFFI
jgi:hypothetical protein